MLITALLSTLALLSPALAVSIKNTLYIITNAETPSLDRPGLTPIGLQRASFHIQDLRRFEPGPHHRLQAEQQDRRVHARERHRRAARRVPGARAGQPLRDRRRCVRRLCRQYADEVREEQHAGDIGCLAEMDDLLENLDIELPGGDDDDDADDVTSHADLLLIKNLKQTVIETSMNCTGIDGPAPGNF
ncbi:hypothetical protein B0H17DRAFT_1129130 [Mycena rosella]|uniref:Uncharacterized protein n=1 Tax=Mycena rosella TaxID=1033263 RepID=A0AAD7DTN8_MYCRO|nr:hypothetical protein B0H17DRAFT_1129130 [Mycena rosella]